MESQKRFIVIAFPRKDFEDGADAKALPTFFWGHDTFSPSVKGKWIRLHEHRDASRLTEQHAWHLSSQDACNIRDAGDLNDLTASYCFRVMEVRTINPSAAEVEAQRAAARRQG